MQSFYVYSYPFNFNVLFWKNRKEKKRVYFGNSLIINFNPFLKCIFQSRLVNTVVKVMGDVFPELKQHELHIRDIIAEEEASFGKTLLKVTMSFIYRWPHYS